jgi:hypothetical protein
LREIKAAEHPARMGLPDQEVQMGLSQKVLD